MAAVLAAVLTMTLNTGTASAATPAATGEAASSTQAHATAECAAPTGNVEAAGISDSPEMVLLAGEARPRQHRRLRLSLMPPASHLRLPRSS